MAAKVLRGEAACADLPYEVIEHYELYVNQEALSALHLTLPETLSAQNVA